MIEEAIQNRVIVALDGAADKLRLLNITPDIILGDFDSIHPKTQAHWGITHAFSTMSDDAKPYHGHHGVLIVPTKDQSETDLVKAIRYCDQQQARDIVIICATFGREDHHEASKEALRTEYQTDRPILLHCEQQSLRWAENESITLHGNIGDHCGILVQAPGYCHSKGLLYECQHSSLSLCNTLKDTEATISINGAALLIMPPQLHAQRAYMKQPEVTRLKHQLTMAEAMSHYCSPTLSQ